MENIKIAIIGSGPAGYSAAVYNARALMQPVVFTGVKSGGQLMYTTDVENYAGFQEGIDGPQLMQQMRAQAEKFGATMVDKFVSAVDLSARPFKLWVGFPDGFDPNKSETLKKEDYLALREQIVAREPDYQAESVVITTGAVSKHVGVPGEMEFMGRGVSTCAVCDAAFYKEKTTFVVGGGDSAMEDSLALAKFASSVTILYRGEELRASKIMADRALNNPKISVKYNTNLQEVIGEGKVTKIKVKENGEDKEYEAGGVFIAIGHQPMTYIFQNQLQLDDHGYVVTRMSATKAGVEAAQAGLTPEGMLAYPSMTSVEGVFAGGDNVDVRYKQAVTAAGMGCMAALDAERWIEAQTGQQGQK